MSKITKQFEAKKNMVAIPGIVNINSTQVNISPTQSLSTTTETKPAPAPKKGATPAKFDPLQSKIKYQYKKFEPWPMSFYKYTEKCLTW